MRRNKIIGLTGQSGAGKSTAAAVFRAHGFEVIDADKQVAEIYKSDPVCLRAAAAVFGGDIIGSDGSLDRPLLAQRAFSSAENTALLGRLVHPFVLADTLKRLKSARGAVVIDAPQLFESNIDAICDCVVSVLASRDICLERVIRRDGISRERAEQRLNAQLSEEYFRENSDFILENNGCEAELIKKTEELISNKEVI